MNCNSYLPKQECQFLHLVMDELDTFHSNSNRMRVLLFPPLPSRLRYLVHNHVEELPDLTTFSVGERECRRVVVCYADLRVDDDDEGDADPDSNSFWDEHTTSMERKHEEKVIAKPKTSNQARHRGSKRPDKPLYMPRAVRERLSLQNAQQPPEDKTLTSPAAGCCPCRSSESFMPETTKSSSTATQEDLNAADCVHKYLDDSPALGPGEVLEPPLLSLANMTLNDEKDTEPSSVSCTDLTEEIKTHLKEPSAVSIEHVQNDFFVYMSVDINLDEFRHVIEIYDFPAVFKKDDLLDAFTEYSNGGMKIKWVDDTHALGVFASESAANNALSIVHPMLKARALAEGGKKAKGKAFRSAEFIQPVKVRPKTDCAVAQRMVTRALGLQKQSRVQRKPPQRTAVIH
ncbi:R3H and coiled-coil domain-containing protein 1 isoform X1 [Takifugu flavidus]|uniref:R3H and coiled-coil domain-containing protein 1 isoform X1 n=1 Tax=Takifugu flavidus TaxID=433684 RepID=UPI0025447A2E|nr:R3H and coiled-coil domain-containing protein 1 isoform X1 [Takifugu flavidus]